MSIDTKTLDKLADLSMLSLSNEEIRSLSADLNDIIAMVDSLKSVNTENISPLKTPLPIVQRYQKDEVTEAPTPDDYQKCASQTEAGLYLVPQVIE